MPPFIFAGIAWVEQRWELELDFRYYFGASRHAAVSSSEDLVLTVVDRDAGTITRTTQPFEIGEEETNDVLNVAIGGHYDVSTTVTLHGGFNTDFSPKDDGDKENPPIDLYHLNFGATFKGEHIATSVGLHIAAGDGDAIQLESLLGSATSDIGGKIEVGMVGLIVATTYHF
jgi:long-subunit fatty acid transport protein